MKQPVHESWWWQVPGKTRERLVAELGNDARDQMWEILQHGSDGCTFAPNILVAQCWVHDALLHLLPDKIANRIFRLSIMDHARGDEWWWRFLWWLTAWVFWLGVTAGSAWSAIKARWS